jgi:hypothetical protein
MKSPNPRHVKVFSILGAVLLTPIAVLFGLFVMAFALGLSLIAAVAVLAFGARVQAAEIKTSTAAA